MAKKSLIVAAVLFVLMTSCFSRSAAMTYSEFDELKTGTNLASLKEQVGEPYSIHTRKDGSKEYEYIERVGTGDNVVAENHYFIILKEGKVIGKYMTRERPPAYDLMYQDEPNYRSNP